MSLNELSSSHYPLISSKFFDMVLENPNIPPFKMSTRKLKMYLGEIFVFNNLKLKFIPWGVKWTLNRYIFDLKGGHVSCVYGI